MMLFTTRTATLLALLAFSLPFAQADLCDEILDPKLRAQVELAELSKEYNNGEPQRTALELRNPQVYIERTAELKASVARAESDVAGIKRELARLPGGAGR